MPKSIKGGFLLPIFTKRISLERLKMRLPTNVNLNSFFDRLFADEYQVSATSGTTQFPAQDRIFMTVDFLLYVIVHHIGKHGDLCFKCFSHLFSESTSITCHNSIPTSSGSIAQCFGILGVT